ncbi:37S ribosomal protein-like protein Rsm22 [Teratosphaeria destructans]|uniref:37S ribosomal protein-like protein Rsm22 n=1 Tax=Teratosphaeria destructans TaxID=418781 RepID=A0A9W7SYM6_9PEZI|nr:37S ribosomal protein-like protein Rsm22 [Teratosphaeria destructans]
MLPLRWLHTSGCASCRIRASIATKQWARSRQAAANGAPRLFTTTTPHRHPRRRPSSKAVPIAGHNDALFAARKQQLGPEEVALRARQAFRDAAPPEGALSGEEQRVYERLYGSGFRVEDAPRPGEEGGPTAAFPLRPTEEAGAGTALLREGAGGVLEEIEFDEEVAMGRKGGRMTKGKKRKKRRGVGGRRVSRSR